MHFGFGIHLDIQQSKGGKSGILKPINFNYTLTIISCQDSVFRGIHYWVYIAPTQTSYDNNDLLSISGIAYHDRSRVALGGVATCGDTQLHIEGGRTRVIFTINSRHGPQLATVSLPAIRSLLSK